MTNATVAAFEAHDYYTVSQAAARLGVSRVSIWRWIRDGHLPATRLGPRTTRIKRDDIERAITRFQTSGPRSPADANGTTIEPIARPVRARSSAAQPVEHAVQFYEDDGHLADVVATFIGEGVCAGEVGIVVATRPHRTAIESRLRAMGCNLASDRYVALDAAQTLTRFMVGDAPDAARFAETLGDVLSHANGRRVRIFGEMVSLLAAGGNAAAAVQLEALWNDLQRAHPFTLLCAYPIGCLDSDVGRNLLDDVCAAHSEVIPAESCSRSATERGRLQAVIALQQQTHRLRSEVAARRRDEEELRLALAMERDAHRETLADQRQRDERISVAAQELKQPLASLSLQAQLALVRLGHESQLEPRQVEQTVAAVAGQPAAIPRLIDVSRLEARRLTLQPRLTDLTTLVETVVAEMRDRGNRHTIALTTPGPLDIWLDPERTRHVLECLLDNAITHSPGGGAIKVTLSPPDAGVVGLTVRDRGPGLAPEKRPLLFERRSPSDRHSDGAGLGLGLYLSRQIAERHGGELFAEFPADGGARFVIHLPTGPDQSAAQTAAD